MTPYTIKQEEQIIRIKFHYSPDLIETMKIVGQVASEYDGRLRLYDMSEVVFDMSHDEIKQISEFGKQVFTKPNRIAILAKDNLSYGVMRMFEVYRTQNEFSKTRVFRNNQEAVDWLIEEGKTFT